ncbi:UNVERIFIED_CONTAM: hypothetical protein K2H54_014561 [Gekko kuhli]
MVQQHWSRYDHFTLEILYAGRRTQEGSPMEEEVMEEHDLELAPAGMQFQKCWSLSNGHGLSRSSLQQPGLLTYKQDNVLCPY